MNYAQNNNMHFVTPPLRGGRWVGVTKYLDKTLLSPIDNQYGVPFCQDLAGTTVMKFKKFCMKKIGQDFKYFKFNVLQNFCQDLSRFKITLNDECRFFLSLLFIYK